jgi:FkbM family methyltransferase
MVRTLRPGDVFVDIGAQLGYFTALGASLVGSVGQVHCFEPVPWLADMLCRLASMNRSHQIIVNEAACGNRDGEAQLYLSSFPHQSSHSLVEELLISNHVPIGEVKRVSVRRLDRYIEETELVPITLIKIDVEGSDCRATSKARRIGP